MYERYKTLISMDEKLEKLQNIVNSHSKTIDLMLLTDEKILETNRNMLKSIKYLNLLSIFNILCIIIILFLIFS